MTIIGVTWTNGKTTTCNIIAKGLRESGKKVLMFSTVNVILDEDEYTNDSKMTSPDAFVLQKLLAEAKKRWCEVAVIETASHGIKMHRVWGIQYDFAVLTNISQDHLDLHRTMKDYVGTKLKLFKDLIIFERKDGVKKTGVINVDSDYKEMFLAETYDSLYTYGMAFEANLHPENIKNGNIFNSWKYIVSSMGVCSFMIRIDQDVSYFFVFCKYINGEILIFKPYIGRNIFYLSRIVFIGKLYN